MGRDARGGILPVLFPNFTGLGHSVLAVHIILHSMRSNCSMALSTKAVQVGREMLFTIG
jgi:hypothetical protein